MHSKQDIENAARLVPEHVFVSVGGIVCVDREEGPNTQWQPWADTEAGRSDALVLAREVDKWWSNASSDGPGPYGINFRITERTRAWLYGTWQEWLDANIDAAAAIGAQMKGVEGESMD